MALDTPRFLHTQRYDAADFRRVVLDSDVQQGVLGATDLLVSQTGAASMNLLVAAGAAWVRGTTSTRQGLYNTYNDANVQVNIGANSSGNPRLDQVILRIYDSTDTPGSNQDIAAIEVLPGGTASPGVTLNNRLNAAVLPANSLLLADVLVASGAVSIANAVIRDRRVWARGFYQQAMGVTSAPTSSSVASPGTLITDMSLTGEFTNVPVQLSFEVGINHSVAGTSVSVAPLLDGAVLTGFSAIDDTVVQTVAAAGSSTASGAFVFTPPAGRHTITLNTWAGAAGTITAVGKRRSLIAEEMVRQVAGNNPAGYG